VSAPAGQHSPIHHHLHVPGGSVVHRLAPEAKIVGVLAFVLAVALTPRHAVWAFAVDAAVVVACVVAARLRARLVVARLVVVVPFLLLALLVPFIAGGEQTRVLGLSLSVEGLWGAWNIVAKALLGATASIVLSATTPVTDLLRGLTRLRVPPLIVGIVAFMFRYLDLVVDQLRRMRTAMVARCHDARWLWQVRPIASAAGVLFVRSYERGERVHQAMLARGYAGRMPELDDARATRRDCLLAALPGVVAAAALLVALVATGTRS
jgi:cobalt/nickel transport system permease protein